MRPPPMRLPKIYAYYICIYIIVTIIPLVINSITSITAITISIIIIISSGIVYIKLNHAKLTCMLMYRASPEEAPEEANVI